MSSSAVVPKSSASSSTRNNDSVVTAAAAAAADAPTRSGDDCGSVGFNYDRLEHDDGTFRFRDEYTEHGGVLLECAGKGGFKIQPRCVQRVKTGFVITNYDKCVSPHAKPYLIIEPHEELNIANVPLRLGEEIVLEIENIHNEDVDYPGHRTVGEVVLVQKFRSSYQNAGSLSPKFV
jgi:hypothetical protein